MVGRKKEIALLEEVCYRDRSSLVAIYGRRRIGKTYLVNYMFREYKTDCIFFDFIGSSDVESKNQIINFLDKIYEWFRVETDKKISNWTEAFSFLKRVLIDKIESRPDEKVVIFIDELPWIDRKNSAGFMDAFGHFWNSFAEPRKNFIVIVCGSNASWIIKNVMKNEGPLHNRVTDQLPMMPFSLLETKDYLEAYGFDLDNRMVLEAYMVFGGVAKYLSYLNPKRSMSDNISQLFFTVNGFLFNEYEQVFKSLFGAKYRYYRDVVDTLGKKRLGLTVSEICEALDVKLGEKIQKTLLELVQCGFIQGISKYGLTSTNIRYRISDPFCTFYHFWVKPLSKNRVAMLPQTYWSDMISTQRYAIWSGYSFESAIFLNIDLYLKARSSKAHYVAVHYWDYRSEDRAIDGTQIDMVVEYKQGLFDIVECKYYSDEFVIDKAYEKNLRNKIKCFREYGVSAKTKSELKLVMLSSFGCKRNSHYYGLNIADDIKLDDLIGKK